jgi:predicted metal-dependent hydrolase
MQTEFLVQGNPARAIENSLDIAGRRIPLHLARHPRARRYVLRLCPDGTARLTVPRGGSARHALDFARRQTAWLQKQLLRQASRPVSNQSWPIGTKIMFRGEMLELLGGDRSIHFGNQTVSPVPANPDLRPSIEAYLRRLAQTELPAETFRLAMVHGFATSSGRPFPRLNARANPVASEFGASVDSEVWSMDVRSTPGQRSDTRLPSPLRRVVIRNQRSRWGSCSRRGTISLNWRLVQTPVFVRDYIILHELAHLKVMNHSKRFWKEVARLCPEYREAETWLKRNSDLLR